MTNSTCIEPNCGEPSVGGGHYCEDHLIERSIVTHQRSTLRAKLDQSAPTTGGSLADMIRRAKAQGILAPLRPEYAHNTP